MKGKPLKQLSWLAEQMRGHTEAFNPNNQMPSLEHAMQRVGGYGTTTEGNCTAECPTNTGAINWLFLQTDKCKVPPVDEEFPCTKPTEGRKALATLKYLAAQKSAVKNLWDTTLTNIEGFRTKLDRLKNIEKTSEVSPALTAYLKSEQVPEDQIAIRNKWEHYGKAFRTYKTKSSDDPAGLNKPHIGQLVGKLEEVLKEQRKKARKQCEQKIDAEKRDMNTKIQELHDRSKKVMKVPFYDLTLEHAQKETYGQIHELLSNLREAVQKWLRNENNKNWTKPWANSGAKLSNAQTLLKTNELGDSLVNWEKWPNWPNNYIAAFEEASTKEDSALEALNLYAEITKKVEGIKEEAEKAVVEWNKAAAQANGGYSSYPNWPKKDGVHSVAVQELVKKNWPDKPEKAMWGVLPNWESVQVLIDAFKSSATFLKARTNFIAAVNKLNEIHTVNTPTNLRLMCLQNDVTEYLDACAVDAVVSFTNLHNYTGIVRYKKSKEDALEFIKTPIYAQPSGTIPNADQNLNLIKKQEKKALEELTKKINLQYDRLDTLNNIAVSDHVVDDIEWESDAHLWKEQIGVIQKIQSIEKKQQLEELKRSIDVAADAMLDSVQRSRSFDPKTLQTYYETLHSIPANDYAFDLHVFLSWYNLLLQKVDDDSGVLSKMLSKIQTVKQALGLGAPRKETSAVAVWLKNDTRESRKKAYDRLLAVSKLKHKLEMEDLKSRMISIAQNDPRAIQINDRLETLKLKWSDSLKTTEEALSYKEADFYILVNKNPVFKAELDRRRKSNNCDANTEEAACNIVDGCVWRSTLTNDYETAPENHPLRQSPYRTRCISDEYDVTFGLEEEEEDDREQQKPLRTRDAEKLVQSMGNHLRPRPTFTNSK